MGFLDALLASDSRRKFLVGTMLVGGAALSAGVGRAIDKAIPGYKRSLDSNYLFVRGAAIGGLLALPVSIFIADKGVEAGVFGNVRRVI